MGTDPKMLFQEVCLATLYSECVWKVDKIY
jgi:hypothetical protein